MSTFFAILSAAGAAVNNSEIVSGPQLPIETVYSNILAFFLTFQASTYYRALGPIVYFWKFAGTYLSLLFFIGIIFVSWKMREFNLKEAQTMTAGSTSAASAEQSPRAKKWQRVVDHAESENPNDWRLAILEADILLDELLDLVGAQGTTIGDKLKSMTSDEMPLLQLAWEAHIVRNRIAHMGGDFILSHREARRVIKLYEDVLRGGLYM